MDKYNVSLQVLSDNKIRELSPLLLAYIGDTVFDLYVRAYLVKNKMGRVTDLHKQASSVVSARAQAQAARFLETQLDTREAEIFRLGKNAKSTPPKNASREDYTLATGLEAVIGYHYLIGNKERTDQLFEAIIMYFFEGESHA